MLKFHFIQQFAHISIKTKEVRNLYKNMLINLHLVHKQWFPNHDTDVVQLQPSIWHPLQQSNVLF